MIDICFNFTHDSFRADEDEVLLRAKQAGVKAMVVVGSDLADSTEGLALAKRYSDVLYAGVGVHPHNAKSWNSDTYQSLRELSKHNKVLTIGETGLDYNRDYSPRATQRYAFEKQIELAAETQLPLFMHQRDAHDDFFAILKSHRKEISKAVVHCFTGNQKMLEDYLDLNLHIGITGWICDERRGQHLQELLPKIPADKLMVETDAPYLLPRTLKQAVKGRRNEPSFLPHIVAQIALGCGVDSATIGARSYANSKQFFGEMTHP